MKNLLFVFILFSFGLQGQSSSLNNTLVFGEFVPDYLQKTIQTGRVAVNGTQTFTSKVEPVAPGWVPLAKPRIRLIKHPEHVLYHAYRLPTALDRQFFLPEPPNLENYLDGIRGAAYGDGQLTPERVLYDAARKAQSSKR